MKTGEYGVWSAVFERWATHEGRIITAPDPRDPELVALAEQGGRGREIRFFPGTIDVMYLPPKEV